MQGAKKSPSAETVEVANEGDEAVALPREARNCLENTKPELVTNAVSETKNSATEFHAQENQLLQEALERISSMAEHFMENIRTTIRKAEENFVPVIAPFVLDARENAKDWVRVFAERIKPLALRDEEIARIATQNITGELIEQAVSIGGSSVRSSWCRLKWSLLRLESTMHPAVAAGVRMLESCRQLSPDRARQARVIAEMAVNDFLSAIADDAPLDFSPAALEKLKKYLFVPIVIKMLPHRSLPESFLEDPFLDSDLYTVLERICRNVEVSHPEAQGSSSSAATPMHPGQPTSSNGMIPPIRKAVKKRRRRGKKLMDSNGNATFLPAVLRDALACPPGPNRQYRTMQPNVLRLHQPICPTTEQSTAAVNAAVAAGVNNGGMVPHVI